MKKKNKVNNFKRFFAILVFVVALASILFGTKIIKSPTNIFTVEKGSISYEEFADGYLIRDEEVLQGENYQNGLVQIVSEGQRTAKNENIFRYYSSEEESLVNQISELDTKINQSIENSGIRVRSSDIFSLESQIEANVNKMHNINEIQKIQEYKKRIEDIVTQKAKISAYNSPEGSEVKTLISQREELEEKLNSSSEIVKATKAGLVSYRVDGLEDTLKVGDFSYINKDLLDSFEVKIGSVVPQSNEEGKIINNYNCYIATYLKTEKSQNAKVGDSVKIRLSNSGNIVNSTIAYVADDDKNGKIVVFEIKRDVEALIEYRRISFDIIWWNFSGYKVPNNALVTEKDVSFIEKNNAGYVDKIPVKVERQNETYSIISTYTDEELAGIGFTPEQIKSFGKLKLYDEIILH